MKKKHILLAVVFCFSLMFCTFKVRANEFNETSAEVNYQNIAYEYVSAAFDDIVSSLMEDDLFMSRVNGVDALKIGVPFFIYDTKDTVQENVFYFPIIDESQNKVVYLIEAIGVNKGYICNSLDHMVDVLNEINYIENPSIAYLSNYNVYFETPSIKINTTDFYNNDYSMKVESFVTSPDEEFVSMSFSEKKEQIFNSMKNLVDYQEWNWVNDEDVLNTKMYGYLTLTNPQGQYGYGMCWAACVATVHNYVMPSPVVTSFEVCNRMGISYDYGGTIYDEQDALWLYNINYNYIRASALTWAQLTNNIDSSKPAIANGINASGGGHAVVVCGYTGASSTSNNVRLWNGNLNGGAGGYQNMSYGTGYFTDGSGTMYYWETTLSYL